MNANDLPVRCVLPAGGTDPCPDGFVCVDGDCLARTTHDAQVVADATMVDGYVADADVDCAVGRECVASDVDTETEACGMCGTHTRTRSCDPTTCSWADFGLWGICAGETGLCAPGAAMPCPNGDSCGRVVCQDDCTWGACEAVNECLRIRPGTVGPEGNNWQCCAPGSWQFCLPTCTWSLDCSLCVDCGC